jgi:phytanoyl-CoA hydroxylase
MALGDVSADHRPVGRPLSDRDRAHYFDEGYLILRRFATAEEVALVNRAVDRVWADKSIYNAVTISAYAGTPEYTETYIRNVDDRARELGNKVNHLYLYDHAVLDLLLSDKVIDVVGNLIEGTPLLFNGLNLEQGSQQRFHFDTFYMPPVVPNKMLASWIALEDADDRAGPLRYYPRSHLIPPYHFSDGRLNAQLEEFPDFDDYIDKHIADRGLDWTTFPARAGDVFIWHAQLYHGGAPIEDMSLTRKSLVTHYFRAQDMDPAVVHDIGGGRCYVRRDHQATDAD